MGTVDFYAIRARCLGNIGGAGIGIQTVFDFLLAQHMRCV